MNFIKKVKGIKLSNNKCYLLFPVLVWFTGINAFAQHGGISIKLEFASVTRSLNRHNPYKGVADKDTVPYLIRIIQTKNYCSELIPRAIIGSMKNIITKIIIMEL